MNRYKTLALLLLISVVVILIVWLVITFIYNSGDHTLAEQFSMPLKLSMMGYGIGISIISVMAAMGIVVNRKKNRERFFGFLYFFFFSVILTIAYVIVFFEDIMR